jgi:hypothetical protein
MLALILTGNRSAARLRPSLQLARAALGAAGGRGNPGRFLVDQVCVPSASPGLFGCISKTKKVKKSPYLLGAPEEIRTPDPQIRSLVSA